MCLILIIEIFVFMLLYNKIKYHTNKFSKIIWSNVFIVKKNNNIYNLFIKKNIFGI